MISQDLFPWIQHPSGFMSSRDLLYDAYPDSIHDRASSDSIAGHPACRQQYPRHKPDWRTLPSTAHRWVQKGFMAVVSVIRCPQRHTGFLWAEVMASSKRGNKQEQPLLFHWWWSSSARGKPLALRLNQYKMLYSTAMHSRPLAHRHGQSLTQKHNDYSEHIQSWF